MGAALGSGNGVLALSQEDSALYAESEGNNFSYGVHARGKGLFGVLGETTGATSAAGIRGLAGNNNGDGLQGIASNGDGVFGFATTGTGVFGTATSGTGMHATSNSGVAVIGVSQNAAGVYGTSNASTGVFGVGPTYGAWGRTTNGTGVFGQATGTGHGVYGAAPGPGRAGLFEGNVFVTGSFTALGAKSAAVTGPDGALRRVYCVEMPESYFEDVGRARLAGGQASVSLDKEFAAIVKSDDYEVFLTPYGDCKGLYVGNRSANGFTVGELQGGKADVPFAYRVLAKRKDTVGGRLEKVNEPDVAKLREAAREPQAPKPREPKQHLELSKVEAPRPTELPR